MSDPIKFLANAFIARADAQQLKGKARDKAALEFACGAAAMVEALRDAGTLYSGNDSPDVTPFAFLVSIRGYSEVLSFAKRELEPTANVQRVELPHVPEFGDPLEHAIARALLAHMKAAGWEAVAVWDSEQYVMAGGAGIPRDAAEAVESPAIMSEADVLDTVFGVDAYPTVHFARADNLKDWGLGVMLVTGNGYDLISDYHTGDDGSRGKAFSDAVEAFVGDGLEGRPLTILPRRTK